MGSLNLPSSGVIYIDAPIVIYSIETHSRYWPVLRAFWQQATTTRSLEIFSSELTLMEALVAPVRRNDSLLIQSYEQLFDSPELHPVAITREVLRDAAHLRASIASLRTPDAIHVACARRVRCDVFFTNDKEFRRVPGLPLIILDELITP